MGRLLFEDYLYAITTCCVNFYRASDNAAGGLSARRGVLTGAVCLTKWCCKLLQFELNSGKFKVRRLPVESMRFTPGT